LADRNRAPIVLPINVVNKAVITAVSLCRTDLAAAVATKAEATMDLALPVKAKTVVDGNLVVRAADRAALIAAHAPPTELQAEQPADSADRVRPEQEADLVDHVPADLVSLHQNLPRVVKNPAHVDAKKKKSTNCVAVDCRMKKRTEKHDSKVSAVPVKKSSSRKMFILMHLKEKRAARRAL
jgi:hypothetical protein